MTSSPVDPTIAPSKCLTLSQCLTGWRRRANTARRAAVLLLLAGLSTTASAQSFTENFDNIDTLVGNGWVMQNNSRVIGLTNWFQGTPTTATPTPGPFDALNGAPNAYIAANYKNRGNASGTISNWLMTPNRTLRNGDIFTFYTRKPTVGPGQTDYPDRLEVRLSTNGASTNVGAPGNNIGDFTTLLLSINPSLLPDVYPEFWTQYSVTLAGLPAPTSGRMAFRYFVTGAANADYIGIDNAVYAPYVCPALTLSPTGVLPDTVFGQPYSVALSQTGALGAPTFAVTAGALPPGLTLSAAGLISGSPTASGTFNATVTASDASSCNGSASYSITVQATTPGAPRAVLGVGGDGSARVTFVQPASDGGSPILSYTATCTADGDKLHIYTGSSPITLTGLTNGTVYTCGVTATNGLGTGPSAPSNPFLPKGNQTITFGAQASQAYGPGGSVAIAPLATASSGLAVHYASDTPDVCTVSGETVSIVAVGTCTIVARQPGTLAWNPAPPVSQSFVIAQAAQVLTFPTQTATTQWFEAGDTFAIDPLATSATPNSGQPIVYAPLDPAVCTVSGTTVTMQALGTCTLLANQDGDDNYIAAPQVATDVELVEPTQADLRIGKTAAVTRARIGDTVLYTIVAANDGPLDATDVQVTDTPPARLGNVVWECVEAIGSTCPSPVDGTDTLDVTLASLPDGASVRFELMAEVFPAADPADDAGPLDNVAAIALPQESTITDPQENNTATSTIVVLPFAVYADGFEGEPE